MNELFLEEKQCGICQSFQPLSAYRKHPTTARLGSTCLDCRNEQKRANREALGPWHKRYLEIKGRAEKIGVPFDLTADFLECLFLGQNRKCFYTGQEMLVGFGNGQKNNNASVDRIVPRLGYVKSNIVICTMRANSIKNDMALDELNTILPDWVARIVDKQRLEV